MNPLLLAMSLAVGAQAHAAIAFDSFAPGGGIAPDNSRISVTGITGGAVAIPFTAGQSGSLEWIESGIQTANSVAAARQFQFRISPDLAGLPGPAIGAFTAEAPFYSSVSFGMPGPVVRHAPALSDPAISLSAGSQYWLQVYFSGAAPVNFTWFLGAQSGASTVARLNGGTWSTQNLAFGTPAARISVPSPSTLSLLAPLTLAVTRRPRRRD